MIVFKEVAVDYPAGRMISSFIREPGWVIEYKLGEVARGRLRPNRRRTPLFAFRDLEQATRFHLGSQNTSHRHFKLLRCYTPRLSEETKATYAQGDDTEVGARRLDAFWGLLKDAGRLFDVIHPLGVRCPWLLPLEEVGDL